ncbi:PHP domain-containing protein [Chloroflexota bacterium]
MIVDLHTHTKRWSDDSDIELSELIWRSKQAGLDAICITDHDWFWDKDVLAKVSQEHDFLVLPGVEMNIDEGHHLLVFGVEKYSFGMHHVEQLKHFVDEAEGIMILAHPYRKQLYSDNELRTVVEQFCQNPIFHLLDTIELLNGRGSEKQNRFSQEVCRRLNLKGVGGSDAHSASDIPSCATLFERRIGNVGELIAELKAGRFKAVNLNQGS